MLTKEKLTPYLERVQKEEMDRWSKVFNEKLEIEKVEEEEKWFVITTKPVEETKIPYKYMIEHWYLTITLVPNTGQEQNKDIIISIVQHIKYKDGVRGLEEYVPKAYNDFEKVEDVKTTKSLGMYCRDLKVS